MSNTSQFSLANRKHFADLLADKPASLRQRAKDRFNSKHSDLVNRYLKEIAEEKGAVSLYDQIKQIDLKKASLDAQLAGLGFRIDYDGTLDTNTRDSGKWIDDLIRKRIAKELGVFQDIDARFDSVAMAMMTVETLSEAQELLKSVQELGN